MAKERTKVNKKPNGKVRRRARKTIASLLLVSAIVVAAIPVPDVAADGVQYALEKTSYSKTTDDATEPDKFPVVQEGDTIFYSETGEFQFAYIPQTLSDTTPVAVLIGSSYGYLENGHLAIPERLDAYVRYTTGDGTYKGNVAADENGNRLYYKYITENRREPVMDAEGNPTGQVNTTSVRSFVEKSGDLTNTTYDGVNTTYYTYQFLPCLNTNIDEWESDKTNYYSHLNGAVDELIDETLVYCDDVAIVEDDDINSQNQIKAKDGKFKTDGVRRLTGALVSYISSKHVVSDGSGNLTIKESGIDPVTGNVSGVFAGYGHMKSLSIPATVSGIGEYAFYGCASLETVTFADNIKILGESAFENCKLLSTINITKNANISQIGQKAFKGCSSLTDFKFSVNNTVLCDEAFAECTSLVNPDFSDATQLQTFGNDVFYGCTSLQSVTLPTALREIGLATFQNCTSLEELYIPEDYEKDIPASVFAGVGGSLKYIYHPNKNYKIVADGTYTLDSFVNELHDEFYVEAYGYKTGSDFTEIHKMTRDKELAFKYIDSNQQYEKIITDGGSQFTYWVNENNELTYIEIKGTSSTYEIEIPASVGPYAITKIGTDFQGNKQVSTIIIPDTVTEIQDGAFAQCTNLTDVIFEEPNNLTYIGTDAFKTEGGTLTFEGTIDAESLPFQYAMNPANKINNPQQLDSYIEFSSGLPTSLKVHYNPETKLTELFEVPEVDSTEFEENVEAAIANSSNTSMSYSTALDTYHNNGSLSTNVFDVIDAAYNIEVPTGVQSLAKGLFSDAYSKKLQKPDNVNKLTNENIVEEAYDFGSVTANDDVASVVMQDVEVIDDFAFYGCDNLSQIIMYPSRNSNGESIGKYSFGHNPKLSAIYLPTTLDTVGVRPFVGDKALTQVYFTPDSTGMPSANIIGNKYSCENGIVYELQDGFRNKIVQCLETRGKSSSTGGNSVGSTMVNADEMAGITAIYKEAFMNCEGIGTVDLSSSSIYEVPAFAFANADSLAYVTLPNGCGTVEEYAFKDTSLKNITLPSTISVFDPAAFYDSDSGVIEYVEVITSENSAAERLAKANSKYYWSVSDNRINPIFTVTFVDIDNKTVIDKQTVELGESAIDPREKEDITMPEHEGKYFVKWDRDFSDIGMDMWVMAVYDENPAQTWTVNFYDWDMTLLVSRTVPDGGAAEEPKSPSRENYTFKGWSKPFDKVTEEVVNEDGELDVIAVYDYNTSGSTGNNGNNGNSGNSGSSNDNKDDKSEKTYTVTVINGSGSGSYVEGATVIVAAYAPNKGYQFHKWTSNDDDVDFASESVAATTFKMPDENVTVTANYITTSESGNTVTNNKNYGTVTSSPSSNKGSTANSTTSKKDNDSSTSVDVNRPGIKNENLASATVNGSTDNFVVRISETPEATAAVAQALKNEYGNLDNIRYFAMDINLYDETGKKKITDTEGLTVTITLPLPDELRQYAGNNKVGAVANNKLEKLAAKFTTVADVPCVTFTATHFSPYTIYVDTGNLTEGIADSTPTTGDGIHPKWFLVIGLGCISALLFMKRDKNLDLAVE